MIDPPIKILKTGLCDRVEVLYYMEYLKASASNIYIAQPVHLIMKRYADSIGMVINNKRSAIQLIFETPLPQTLQENPD